MSYHIDPKIISMFLGVNENDPKVENYMIKYGERFEKIMSEAFEDNLINKGLTKEMIQENYKKYEDGTITKEELEGFMDDSIEEVIQRKINDLNKQIYDYYQSILNNEQKEKINAYLDELEDKMVNEFEESKQMSIEALDNLMQEYYITGKLLSVEEKMAKEESGEMTDDDLMMIQADLERELQGLG